LEAWARWENRGKWVLQEFVIIPLVFNHRPWIIKEMERLMAKVLRKIRVPSMKV